jgi:D-arabinose 5-phosphate isomerase GutQ
MLKKMINISFPLDMYNAGEFISALSTDTLETKREIIYGKKILLAGLGTSGGAAALFAELLKHKKESNVTCWINEISFGQRDDFDLGIVFTSSGRHDDSLMLIEQVSVQATQTVVISGMCPEKQLDVRPPKTCVYLYPKGDVIVSGAFCPVTRILSMLCEACKFFDDVITTSILKQTWESVAKWAMTDDLPLMNEKLVRPLVVSWTDFGKSAALDFCSRLHELGRYDVIPVELLGIAHGQYKMITSDTVLLLFSNKSIPALCWIQDTIPASNLAIISSESQGVLTALDLYFKALYLVEPALKRTPYLLQWNNAPQWGTRLYEQLGTRIADSQNTK